MSDACLRKWIAARAVVRRVAWLAVIGWAFACSPAQADFSEPEDISPDEYAGVYARVGLDESGNALIFWNDPTCCRLYHPVYVRTRSAGGVLGRVIELSGRFGTDYEYRVAVNGDGDGMAVWRRYRGEEEGQGRILARPVNTAGVVGPLRVIFRENAEDRNLGVPEVAIDDEGNALVVWLQNERVKGRTISAAGERGPIQTISERGTGLDVRDPQVGMSADGDALIVWTIGETGRVQARSRSADGVLGPIENVSPGDLRASSDNVRVAVNDDGAALVAWPTNRRRLMQARFRFAEGDWAAVQDIASTDDSGRISSPDLVLRDNGAALLLWRLKDGVQGRTRSAAGTLGDTDDIVPAGELRPFRRSYAAEGDADGDTQIAWSDDEESPRTRTRFADGTLSPITCSPRTRASCRKWM